MFAQLGNHIFDGLKAPSSLSSSEAVQFGQVARINGKPAIQPTGAELAELSLTAVFADDFCDPQAEIDALRRSMEEFEVLPYIMGDGRIVGHFVITSLEVGTLRCDANGRVEMASVMIGLLENTDTSEQPNTGLALASNTPLPEVPATAVPTEASSMTEELGRATTNVSGIKRLLASIRSKTTGFKSGVRDIRQLADDTQTAYATVQTKLAAADKLVTRASNLPTSLDEAIGYAENLARLDYTADMTVLEMNVEQLSRSAEQVSADAAPVVCFVATKEGGV